MVDVGGGAPKRSGGSRSARNSRWNRHRSETMTRPELAYYSVGSRLDPRMATRSELSQLTTWGIGWSTLSKTP